jgi:hypothetical protein
MLHLHLAQEPFRVDALMSRHDYLCSLQLVAKHLLAESHAFPFPIDSTTVRLTWIICAASTLQYWPKSENVLASASRPRGVASGPNVTAIGGFRCLLDLRTLSHMNPYIRCKLHNFAENAALLVGGLKLCWHSEALHSVIIWFTPSSIMAVPYQVSDQNLLSQCQARGVGVGRSKRIPGNHQNPAHYSRRTHCHPPSSSSIFVTFLRFPSHLLCKPLRD